MTKELIAAIKTLKSWVGQNETILEQKKYQDGREEHLSVGLQFNIQAITKAELEAIKHFTKNLLPESYYYFLSEIGAGQFFINEGFPCFEIYTLAELQASQCFIQQEIDTAEEVVLDEFMMIGSHCAMGDWMGFCTSNKAIHNFDVFCHEYPIESYVEVSDELISWRTFDEWLITAIETKGQKTL